MSVPLQASIRASPDLNFFRHMLLLKLLSIDWSVAGAKNPAVTFIVCKGLSHLHRAQRFDTSELEELQESSTTRTIIYSQDPPLPAVTPPLTRCYYNPSRCYWERFSSFGLMSNVFSGTTLLSKLALLEKDLIEAPQSLTSKARKQNTSPSWQSAPDPCKLRHIFITPLATNDDDTSPLDLCFDLDIAVFLLVSISYVSLKHQNQARAEHTTTSAMFRCQGHTTDRV